MKFFISILILLLAFTSTLAQKPGPWQRAYTFEDSFIDMNANVILGGDIGRVTFRWVFNQPEPLSGKANSKYKSRLETIEFKCGDKLYRMYEVRFLDSSGKAIHSEIMKSPYEWHRLKSDGPMTTIFAQACQLIEAKLHPQPAGKSPYELESERVFKVVLLIIESLERSGDFQPIIQKFFAPHFVRGYLSDEDRNWFYNLDRNTASKASLADLQRFYVAQMNAGYLTSLYLIKSSSGTEATSEIAPDEKLIPAEVLRLINSHHYTLTYKQKAASYDYLAENIDSIARMRSYTELLEGIANAMRKHVPHKRIHTTEEYDDTLDLKSRVSAREYLGLPPGTKLFEIGLPLLRLELAEIKGQLKVVSARDSSQ
jgi:hypothetical protein